MKYAVTFEDSCRFYCRARDEFWCDKQFDISEPGDRNIFLNCECDICPYKEPISVTCESFNSENFSEI